MDKIKKIMDCIDNKLDEYSKKAEPHMKVWIIITLLASVITPFLFYLYSTYKYLLEKNDYVYLGILMLLIPILLEVLFSLGIKKRLVPGVVFALLYFLLLRVLSTGEKQNEWLVATSMVFLGYLISSIFVNGILIWTKQLASIFSKAHNIVALLGQVMVPILGTAIPIAIAVAVKYLLI
jgi:uncharacterized membrane protein